MSFNKNLQAKSFDTIAASYNKGRLDYPGILFKEIDTFAKIDKYSKILEIGAGSGIASKQIIEHWNPYLTLLEPGRDLINILRSRFDSNPKVEIQQDSFEGYNSDKKFDAIISATAFHWLNPEVKYTKSHQCL